MFLARVDNRLIHGQIIETWIPFAGSRLLIVANDELSVDIIRQEIMSLAVPAGIGTTFVEVDKVSFFVSECCRVIEHSQLLVLFASCCDALRAFEDGLAMESVNIGNIHYGPGKRQLCAHVALSAEDELCLRRFISLRVELDFRCIPSEPAYIRSWW
ncbi:PTS system, mannose-specific IIB component [Desulfovibrionales bacterium]